MDKIYKEFVIDTTTKEQFLKFKEELKTNKYHTHAFYVAYYIFKHRIGEDPETHLRDSQVINQYLDDVVIPACHKGLYNGYIGNCGGDCVKYGINNLKYEIRSLYNAHVYTQE